MVCAKCKTILPSEARFCPHCGLAVSDRVRVEQEVRAVDGEVVGTELQGETLPTGLNVTTMQKVDTVGSGGTVVGVVAGSGDSPIHLGGEEHYGDEFSGDKITVGPVSDSTGFAIGRGSQVNVTQGAMSDDISRLFAAVYEQIQARSVDPNVDSAELMETVQKIEQEAAKGETANPNKVERWLKTLANIAPDIWEVTVACLTHPLAGVATVIRKVVDKAQMDFNPKS